MVDRALHPEGGLVTLHPDAEPSRKERGQRGVRPRHPPGEGSRASSGEKAFGLDPTGSSSGLDPRRFRSCAARRRAAAHTGRAPTPDGHPEL